MEFIYLIRFSHFCYHYGSYAFTLWISLSYDILWKRSLGGMQRVWYSRVRSEVEHWGMVAISEMGADSVTDGP